MKYTSLVVMTLEDKNLLKPLLDWGSWGRVWIAILQYCNLHDLQGWSEISRQTWAWHRKTQAMLRSQEQDFPHVYFLVFWHDMSVLCRPRFGFFLIRFKRQLFVAKYARTFSLEFSFFLQEGVLPCSPRHLCMFLCVMIAAELPVTLLLFLQWKFICNMTVQFSNRTDHASHAYPRSAKEPSLWSPVSLYIY